MNSDEVIKLWRKKSLTILKDYITVSQLSSYGDKGESYYTKKLHNNITVNQLSSYGDKGESFYTKKQHNNITT